jgi:hypothetical protein
MAGYLSEILLLVTFGSVMSKKVESFHCPMTLIGIVSCSVRRCLHKDPQDGSPNPKSACVVIAGGTLQRAGLRLPTARKKDAVEDRSSCR